MAALYLHNAIFARDSPHSRTLSSGTVATVSLSSSTHNSHPTEPLLSSSTYQDLLSRQPGHNTDGQQWDMNLSFEGGPDSPIERERRGYWEQSVRRKLRILKATKVSLEVIVAIWALYNTIRYFLAFTMYSSIPGQTTALALGTSTAVCVACLACAAIVSALQPYLIAKHIPIRSLLVTRTIFRYLGSFFLFSPTVVNLILTIIWRNSADDELASGNRCLDVDIIWSISPKCSSSTWAAWLALSIFRVLMTAVILILLLGISKIYSLTRRPSQSSSRRRLRSRRKLQRESSTLTTSTAPPMSFTSSGLSRPVSASLPYPSPLRHASRSSVTLTSPGGNTLRPVGPSRETSHASSSHNANRFSRDSSTSNPENANGNIRDSYSSEGAGSSDESPSDARFDPAAIQQRLNDALSPTQTRGTTYFTQGSPTPAQSPTHSDRELNSFVDRFRSLVAQLQRETEEALEYAMEAEDEEDGEDDEEAGLDRYTAVPSRQHRSRDRDSSGATTPTQSRNPYAQYLQGSGSNSQPPAYVSNSGSGSSGSAVPPSAYHSSYNSALYKEFGLSYSAYPPDDQIRFLNGYVKRMPTIESLSSKEFPDLGDNWGNGSVSPTNGSRKGSVSERSGKSGQSVKSVVSVSSHEILGNGGGVRNAKSKSPTMVPPSGHEVVKGTGPIIGDARTLSADTQSLGSIGSIGSLGSIGSIGSLGSLRSVGSAGTFGGVPGNADRDRDRDMELESPSTDYGSVYSYGSYGGLGGGGFDRLGAASLSGASMMSVSMSEKGLGSEPSSRRNSLGGSSIATSSISGKGKGKALFGGTTTATETVVDVEEMGEFIGRIAKETQAQIHAQAHTHGMLAQGRGHGMNPSVEREWETVASPSPPNSSPVSSKSSRTTGSKASYYTAGSTQNGSSAMMLTPTSELLPPTPEYEEV